MAALAQSLALAWASGISVYATVALLGIAGRLGWVGPLPSSLDGVTDLWVIALAGVLYVFEFSATLIPGIASAWETFHSAIRPVAGAAIAVATVWHADHRVVLSAALLGGTLALGTHATKLGLRYAIDTSPEPVTNGIANVAELGVVATVALLVWHHPYVALTVALALLLLGALALRALWRLLKATFRRRP
ncbi:protein of unknown function DUF4126 [Gemmatirosa kalamazoonensis]|uniref:DUF4126 domain-containing protein n=1 Tax=Gemmatirosa kalamazoonensis TaxID=861299 RepID=W0RE29_9BACT|nr:DUF4126 domain-containing protein [Gemmatirosa kalamazoonensis]AHG88677.1 protein of unknown function DUF4126 [Gemmatirosa kalamazoonensis]